MSEIPLLNYNGCPGVNPKNKSQVFKYLSVPGNPYNDHWTCSNSHVACDTIWALHILLLVLPEHIPITKHTPVVQPLGITFQWADRFQKYLFGLFFIYLNTETFKAPQQVFKDFLKTIPIPIQHPYIVYIKYHVQNLLHLFFPPTQISQFCNTTSTTTLKIENYPPGFLKPPHETHLIFPPIYFNTSNPPVYL